MRNVVLAVWFVTLVCPPLLGAQQPAGPPKTARETSCARGTKLWYPLNPDLNAHAAFTVKEKGGERVRIAFIFTGVNRRRITGLAECEYKGSASAGVKPWKVSLTSNGATEVLTRKELGCFARGEFC